MSERLRMNSQRLTILAVQSASKYRNSVSSGMRRGSGEFRMFSVLSVIASLNRWYCESLRFHWNEKKTSSRSGSTFRMAKSLSHSTPSVSAGLTTTNRAIDISRGTSACHRSESR
jgi:hypothetical protein